MNDLHRVLVSFTKAASDRDSRRAGRGNGIVLTATAAADRWRRWSIARTIAVPDSGLQDLVHIV